MSEDRPSAYSAAYAQGASTATGKEEGLGGGTPWPVAETQHRVRNLLALIRSVVHRTARSSETVEDYVSHLEGRLGALGRAQEMSLRWPDGKGIDLEYLLAEEFLAQSASEDRQVTLNGPPIELRNRPAMLLGLAFHELAVNAVKYGALATGTGHIGVEWQVEPAGQHQSGVLQLQWKETGALGSTTARRPGFGTELIERMLGYELGATAALDVEQDGLRCTITVPLTPDITPGAPAD